MVLKEIFFINTSQPITPFILKVIARTTLLNASLISLQTGDACAGAMIWCA